MCGCFCIPITLNPPEYIWLPFSIFVKESIIWHSPKCVRYYICENIIVLYISSEWMDWADMNSSGRPGPGVNAITGAAPGSAKEIYLKSEFNCKLWFLLDIPGCTPITNPSLAGQWARLFEQHYQPSPLLAHSHINTSQVPLLTAKWVGAFQLPRVIIYIKSLWWAECSSRGRSGGAQIND